MGKMKKLTVELFGPARRLSGLKKIDDVIDILAEEFPQFVDTVIQPGSQLSAAYILNYNGKRTARSLDETPEEGDNLLLLPVDAGG